MKQLVISLARRAGKTALELYRRDRDHYVRLLEPYTVGRFLIDIPDFGCDLFIIHDRVLTLKPVEARHCDGATLAPDKIGGRDFACAYIAHDFWYEMIDSMAADKAFQELGLDAERLQEIGDAMLAEQMARKSRLWARLYHWAVRRFGGFFRKHPLPVIAMSLLLMSGCAGCAQFPDGIFEPGDDDPVYEVVPKNGSAVEPRRDALCCALGGSPVAGDCLHVKAPADDCRAN